ncbi:hypothetical protein AB0H57_08770 [Micromonospora sp. NPDC050686]|uniref:hypothetical protein n=1 Tax=Micromonospora sp. NPDC050686 TaxID=3154631 RepID=UPI0034022BC1
MGESDSIQIRCARGEPIQTMKIDKSKIVEALRHRGQHSRADWVDRELPDHVDTAQHSGILATLNLNPADFADPPS